MLSDFHIHSTCSPDGRNTMPEMAAAAKEAGISVLCFTDHCDLDSFPAGVFDPRCFDFWPEYRGRYADLCAHRPEGIDLRLGLELGEINHAPELARDIAGHTEFDFILGSIHNLRDTQDFFLLRYESEAHCAALLERYLDELWELAGLDSFDCISHIGYPRRYMLRAGFQTAVEDAPFGPRLDALLKRVIENGKGIEINCSGFRRPALNAPLPGIPILRRYRELGGEIITTGSDAHRVSDAGRGIERGAELLRELGYRYYTVYKGRKPEFIKL
ncbi:MAG: histidinol-phosphatase HisJ family protein [Firmicutes bacterium]|nr:histidinol-phosphatase HisJ family protein [Bacillota bacterium]